MHSVCAHPGNCGNAPTSLPTFFIFWLELPLPVINSIYDIQYITYYITHDKMMIWFCENGGRVIVMVKKPSS